MLRGYVNGCSESALAHHISELSQENVATWLKELNGNYSIIVKTEKFSFAASDRIRSFPLVWTCVGDRYIVTDNGPLLESAGLKETWNIDPTAALAVAMSGYTIGASTLFLDVEQIGPGRCLWIDDNGPRSIAYYQWSPWIVEERSEEALKGSLLALNESLIERLARSADGRQIVVPLSAGLDSRMIASGLRACGYKNVLCVAYGLAGNREAVTSRMIASALEYPWIFVPFDHKSLSRDFASSTYKEYRRYSDSLTGMHFPQDFSIFPQLREKSQIDEGAIIVNGQSGDFITGNHIPSNLANKQSSGSDWKQSVVTELLSKHYQLWAGLVTPEHTAQIGASLLTELNKQFGETFDSELAWAAYEYCEYQDRQSKYVLNGQRVYEFHGYEWRLPLWENEYLDFWGRVPLQMKKHQRLYRTVLEEQNWGGVWRDIAVNPTTIRPAWIIPVRLLAKALFSVLGKEKWHRFERQYLHYWMAANCGYAAWRFSKVAFDNRGFRSAISWHAAEYLQSKGLCWDGSKMQASSND